MMLTREFIDPAQSSTQYALWAGVDSRPGLGYCVIAREVVPAGSFVFEYAGQYLTVSFSASMLRLTVRSSYLTRCISTRLSPSAQSDVQCPGCARP